MLYGGGAGWQVCVESLDYGAVSRLTHFGGDGLVGAAALFVWARHPLAGEAGEDRDVNGFGGSFAEEAGELLRAAAGFFVCDGEGHYKVLVMFRVAARIGKVGQVWQAALGAVGSLPWGAAALALALVSEKRALFDVALDYGVMSGVELFVCEGVFHAAEGGAVAIHSFVGEAVLDGERYGGGGGVFDEVG